MSLAVCISANVFEAPGSQNQRKVHKKTKLCLAKNRNLLFVPVYSEVVEGARMSILKESEGKVWSLALEGESRKGEKGKESDFATFGNSTSRSSRLLQEE